MQMIVWISKQCAITSLPWGYARIDANVLEVAAAAMYWKKLSFGSKINSSDLSVALDFDWISTSFNLMNS